MAVGTMIAVPVKCGEDTETENQYTLINIENIEVGNITVIPNGNEKRVVGYGSQLVSKTKGEGSIPSLRAENIITTARSRLWWSGGETRRSVETIEDGYDYVLKLKG